MIQYVSSRYRNIRYLRATAAIAIVLLVSRYIFKRKRKAQSRLISDLKRVASPLDNKAANHPPQEYDIVIVGGGTAGCVLASRLSEDPSLSVLLLEAGASSIPLTYSQIPALFYKLFLTEHDYHLYTVPQEHATGRARYWPRGKFLGGCSSMNAMIYHCCTPSDFDEWTELQRNAPGARGWSYAEFHKYFERFEKYIPSKRHPLVDTSLRSSTGSVEVGHFGDLSPLTSDFLSSCDKVGIKKSRDLNTHRGTLGSLMFTTYINANGRRVSTESAYLTPEVLARPNLKVATHAQTTRILFEQKIIGSVKTTRAVGVEFTNPSGQRFQVRARKEVIVSAGAIHTPQVLMLSGIGPADHLASHNIPVIADLPGVGSHLMDHPVVALNYKVKTPRPWSLFPRALVIRVETMLSMLQYRLTGKGPLTSNVGEAGAFFSSTDTKLFPPNQYPSKGLEDSASGPGAPDLELLYTPCAYGRYAGVLNAVGNHVCVHAILLRPTSTGTIRLKSGDPNDPPLIDPKYLSTKHDVDVFTRGIRMIGRVASAEPLASMIDPAGENNPHSRHLIETYSDAEVEQLVRDTVETIYHPVSTARMAPLEDGGVVDPFLRVHGIPNLRIVDASVFPTIVSGHTSAPVIAVAERAAALIKAADLIDSAII